MILLYPHHLLHIDFYLASTVLQTIQYPLRLPLVTPAYPTFTLGISALSLEELLPSPLCQGQFPKSQGILHSLER